jgi:hypothetical protein
MSLFCQWKPILADWVCSECGAVVPKNTDEPPLAGCPVGAQNAGIRFSDIASAGSVVKVTPVAKQNGPGLELKKMLRSFGIYETAGCKCNQRSLQMDLWGPDECERRIEEIVRWMKEEADIRGLPFIPAAARMLVRRAIKKSRSNSSGSK